MAGQWRFVIGGGGISVNDELALLGTARPIDLPSLAPVGGAILLLSMIGGFHV
jgi:hypothetical protein